MMITNQLHLFPTILKMIELEADSPKRAFYRLMVEESMGVWAVVKESGAAGKVLDRRRWVMESAEKAVAKYEKILRDKLNPNRGSPRKYKIKRAPGSARFGGKRYADVEPLTIIKHQKSG